LKKLSRIFAVMMVLMLFFSVSAGAVFAEGENGSSNGTDWKPNLNQADAGLPSEDDAKSWMSDMIADGRFWGLIIGLSAGTLAFMGLGIYVKIRGGSQNAKEVASSWSKWIVVGTVLIVGAPWLMGAIFGIASKN